MRLETATKKERMKRKEKTEKWTPIPNPSDSQPVRYHHISISTTK
jgi:hypothetical protein